MALSRSMKNLMHDAAQARRGGGNPNPTGGGMSGMLGKAFQQARSRGTRYNPGPPGPEAPSGPLTRPRGGVGTPGAAQRSTARSFLGKPTTPAAPGPVLRPSPGRTPMTGGTRGPRGPVRPGGPGGPVMPRGGVMGGPAGRRGMAGTVAGKPMPRGGTGGVVGPTRPGAGTFGFAARGGGGTPALQEATAAARSQTMRQAAARGAAPRPAGGVPGGVAGAAGRARAAVPAALAQPRGQSVASRIGGTQGPPARRGGMARALGSGGSRRRMLR